MGEHGPLVSVGLPVRNGAATLARALASIVEQSYRNLDIVISDNASTDATEAIGREFAARDPRIRYLRQPRLLPVMENYRFAFEQARGELFMFAAHDDLRSADYVATLVEALRANPDASLAASDFVEFFDYAEVGQLPPREHDFSTVGLGLVGRLRKHTRIGCTHVYGLIRRSLAQGYGWYEDVSWDVVFLSYLVARGPFVYAPGATFYYRRDPARTPEIRATETSFGRLQRWQVARTAWNAARAASDGYRTDGRWRPAAATAPIYFYFFSQGIRGVVASMAPPAIRSFWRRLTGSASA